MYIIMTGNNNVHKMIGINNSPFTILETIIHILSSGKIIVSGLLRHFPGFS